MDPGMRKRLKNIPLAIVGCIATAFLVLMLSAVFYDRSNSRNRPNSYLIEASVEVGKPIHDVYEFVKYRKPEVYIGLTGMHDKFQILNADGLIEGAEIECVEGDEEDVIHHRYIVTRDKRNELIQYESRPSVIFDKETNKKTGECNTFVYYDFIRLDDARTILKQTTVIDMMNPLNKAIGDIVGLLSGSRGAWARQFQEELEILKMHIEK